MKIIKVMLTIIITIAREILATVMKGIITKLIKLSLGE